MCYRFPPQIERSFSLPTLCLFAETLEQKNRPESIGANVEGGYSVVDERELTFSFFVWGWCGTTATLIISNWRLIFNSIFSCHSNEIVGVEKSNIILAIPKIRLKLWLVLSWCRQQILMEFVENSLLQFKMAGSVSVSLFLPHGRDPHNRVANCYVGRLNKAAAYKHLKISEYQTPHSPLSRKFS